MRKIYGLVLLLAVVGFAFWFYVANKSNLKSDEYYMDLAISAAKNNPKAPFGAVIVDNKTGAVIAAGYNMGDESPTYHGEIVAINNAAKKFPHLDWKNTTIYTTGEPCSMCQSAIVWAGISRVVYGTSIDYLKMHGWNQIDIKPSEVNGKAPFYQGELKGGVLQERTDAIFGNSTKQPALRLAGH